MWSAHCIVLPDVQYVSNVLWLCILVWPLYLLESRYFLYLYWQRALPPEAILNDILDLEVFVCLLFDHISGIISGPCFSTQWVWLKVRHSQWKDKGIYGYWLTPWGEFYTTSPLGKQLLRDPGFWVGVCDLNPALLRALTTGIYLPGKHWLQRSLTPEDVLAYSFWHLRNSLTLWPAHPGIKFMILYSNWHFYLCNTWRDFHIARKISIM